MFDNETEDLLLQIVSGSVFEKQREQAVEECAELILAAQKLKREWTNETQNNFYEEVADSLVMLMQMRAYCGRDMIDSIMKEKMHRQIRRLRGEE